MDSFGHYFALIRLKKIPHSETEKAIPHFHFMIDDECSIVLILGTITLADNWKHLVAMEIQVSRHP